MSRQWNVTKVALWGALIGAIYSFGKAAIGPAGFEIVGAMAGAVGGAVAGAFLFAVVAALRNMFARRNSN
jgi:outer membrane lipoprotein SlyB